MNWNLLEMSNLDYSSHDFHSYQSQCKQTTVEILKGHRHHSTIHSLQIFVITDICIHERTTITRKSQLVSRLHHGEANHLSYLVANRLLLIATIIATNHCSCKPWRSNKRSTLHLHTSEQCIWKSICTSTRTEWLPFQAQKFKITFFRDSCTKNRPPGARQLSRECISL